MRSWHWRSAHPFTHFHWDHLIGLPFFTPIFIPGNKIHVYAVQPELTSVFELFLETVFSCRARGIGCADYLSPTRTSKTGQVLEAITVTPYQLDHPDPCWGYRMEEGGKYMRTAFDTECTRVSREQLGPDLGLYQNVDLMIFDAQYTLMETIDKVNWGHAAASLGLDIAMREGVKRVYFMHHDPASSMERLLRPEAQARHYYDAQLRSRQKGHRPKNCTKWTGPSLTRSRHRRLGRPYLKVGRTFLFSPWRFLPILKTACSGPFTQKKRISQYIRVHLIRP